MKQKLLFKISGYLLGLIAVYAAVVFCCSALMVNGRPISWYVFENKNESGSDSGQSLIKFRDIEQFRDVDILVLGSSHAYRSFDPRIFHAAGLTMFNLGTTSQTPLNSFFLLRSYYQKLKPKLIILETYFEVFESKDGLESFYDIIRNAPLSKEVLFMALATLSPQAIHSLLSEFFIRFWNPLPFRTQRYVEKELYVPGGYVESQRMNVSGGGVESKIITLNPRQLDFIKEINSFSKKHGVRFWLVLAPLPRRKIDSMINYYEIIDRFRSLALSYGVPFDTFESLPLDPKKDFKDGDHLNCFGATKFNEEILRIFNERQY